MNAIFLIISDDFKQGIKSKYLLLLLVTFIISPLFVNFFAIYLIRPGFNFFGLGIVECVSLFTESNLTLFLMNFSLIGSIYAMIKGSSFFASNLKDGTIKIYLSLPIRRIDLFLSQIIEFIAQIAIFTMFGFILTNLVWSFVCSGSVLPFLFIFPKLLVYWIVTVLLITAVFSVTTFINILGSGIISVLISMLFFLIYPLFLFNQIVNGIYLMATFSTFDQFAYVQILDLLYLFRLDFHAYSILSRLIPELAMIDSTSVILTTFSFHFIGDLFESLLILTSYSVIPLGLGLSIFIFMDIKD